MLIFKLHCARLPNAQPDSAARPIETVKKIDYRIIDFPLSLRRCMVEGLDHSFPKGDAQPQLIHVVLTRFNLPTGGREAPLRNQPDWLAKRFDLFERFCLPSMAAQTCQDFEWIIYFDDATPREFRIRIKEDQGIRRFHAMFLTTLDPHLGGKSTYEFIGERPGAMLLTTKLDNDNSLSKHFVAKLQQAAVGHRGGTAFNFTNGYVLSGNRLYLHCHRSNAFVNFLEAYTPEAMTAIKFRHMQLARNAVVVQLEEPRAWLQVVHGANVSNRTRGRLVAKKDLEDDLADFPASAISEVVDPPWTEVLSGRLISEPLRASRDLASGLINKIGVAQTLSDSLRAGQNCLRGISTRQKQQSLKESGHN